MGVLDAWMWARGPKDAPQVKESTRWVEGYEVVADLAETVPDTRLVYGADREGDRRALMDAAARRAHPADWLVRSKHNRNTTTGEKRWDRLARSEPLGGGIRPAGGTGPTGACGTTNPVPGTVVTVTAILAREEHPPAGEKAIDWRLLTNRPADALEAVVQLIDWYRRRWLVEIFSGPGNRAAGSRRCDRAPWSDWNGPWSLT